MLDGEKADYALSREPAKSKDNPTSTASGK